eukprot:763874-Hanusia_phi.AAC.3
MLVLRAPGVIDGMVSHYLAEEALSLRAVTVIRELSWPLLAEGQQSRTINANSRSLMSNVYRKIFVQSPSCHPPPPTCKVRHGPQHPTDREQEHGAMKRGEHDELARESAPDLHMPCRLHSPESC